MWVRVIAKRRLETGTAPSVIEAYLIDAEGFRWQIVDKAVMFREFAELEDSRSAFPMAASLPCQLVFPDDGGPTLRIVLAQDVFDADRVYNVDRASVDPR